MTAVGVPAAAEPLLRAAPSRPSAKLLPGRFLPGRELVELDRSRIAGGAALAAALDAPAGVAEVVDHLLPEVTEVLLGYERWVDSVRWKLYLGNDRRGLHAGPRAPVEGDVVHLAAKWSAGSDEVQWAWYLRRDLAPEALTAEVRALLAPSGIRGDALADAVMPLLDRVEDRPEVAQRALTVVEDHSARRSLDLMLARPQARISDVAEVVAAAAGALGVSGEAGEAVAGWLVAHAHRRLVRLGVGIDAGGEPFATFFHT